MNYLDDDLVVKLDLSAREHSLIINDGTARRHTIIPHRQFVEERESYRMNVELFPYMDDVKEMLHKETTRSYKLPIQNVPVEVFLLPTLKSRNIVQFLESEKIAVDVETIRKRFSENREGLMMVDALTVLSTRHTYDEPFENVVYALTKLDEPEKIAPVAKTIEITYRQLFKVTLLEHWKESIHMRRTN